MAIAKNPHGNTTALKDRRAEAFIAKAGKGPAEPEGKVNKKPTMIRIPPDLLARIDRGAKRLGINRSAFIVQSAARELERMDGREI